MLASAVSNSTNSTDDGTRTDDGARIDDGARTDDAARTEDGTRAGVGARTEDGTRAGAGARTEAGPAMPTPAAAVSQRPLAGVGQGAWLTSGLLYDWQRRNASASMPLALRQLEAAGNLDNIRLAIGPVPGTSYHKPVFMDSDIYKTLEAIGWELARAGQSDVGQSEAGQSHDGQSDAGRSHDGQSDVGRSRDALADFAGSTAELLGKAQQSDGYLNSYVQVSGEPRYSHLARSHEMYCAGHLFQAAIALHRGAGDDRLLAVATRFADHLVREFADREKGLDGHPIVETALVELYRETNVNDYLYLAQQFVNQRGHGLVGDSGMGHRYLQDHLPVRTSPTEVGHAVRALYLEAGVADVAVETRDQDLLRSSIRRWDDMVATKTYLTGGNGSRHADEAFGDRFELPPDRAYNETCAAIASFQWSWRLLLATGEPKYADHMERVLYNGFAAAISAEGDRFFYVNPLQRRDDHFEKDDPGRRREWFSCACCPPNIMRTLASVEHYLATTDDDTLYLHQYTGARITGGGLALDVSTEYPWSALVTIRVLDAQPGSRTLALRIPPWSANSSVQINQYAERTVARQTGYLRLDREWRAGDEVTLHLDMTPRWTYPDRRVDAVRGCAAIERGPLVYCLEQADQLVRLDELAVRAGARLTEREATIDGVGRTIQVSVAARHTPPPAAQAAVRVSAVAIPYFQWDNRGPGAMRVWIPGA
jgi:uncharacterized protein